jgi:hypothetical protein
MLAHIVTSPCACALPSEQVVIGAINTNLETPISSHQAAEKMAALQGQLCGVLQVCMERLCRSDDARAALVPFRDKVSRATSYLV